MNRKDNTIRFNSQQAIHRMLHDKTIAKKIEQTIETNRPTTKTSITSLNISKSII